MQHTHPTLAPADLDAFERRLISATHLALSDITGQRYAARDGEDLGVAMIDALYGLSWFIESERARFGVDRREVDVTVDHEALHDLAP